jgi:hypothetical protein
MGWILGSGSFCWLFSLRVYLYHQKGSLAMGGLMPSYNNIRIERLLCYKMIGI